MKFGFIAKHRGIWPAGWLCEALGVSRGGFYAWLTRPRSQRSRSDEELGVKVRASFLASDRTYGARRVWRDLLPEGMSCGLHRIERLMRLQALKARPRRRRLPPDLGERQATAVAPRPGGNATGIKSLNVELTAKRLGLLRELAPQATRFVALVSPNAAMTDAIVKNVHASVPILGSPVEILYAGTSDRDIEAAFANLSQEPGAALLVTVVLAPGRAAGSVRCCSACSWCVRQSCDQVPST